MPNDTTLKPREIAIQITEALREASRGKALGEEGITDIIQGVISTHRAAPQGHEGLRYFFVSYHFEGPTKHGDGSLWFECESFPSRNLIGEKIQGFIRTGTFSILTIQELSQADYEAFTDRAAAVEK